VLYNYILRILTLTRSVYSSAVLRTGLEGRITKFARVGRYVCSWAGRCRFAWEFV